MMRTANTRNSRLDQPAASLHKTLSPVPADLQFLRAVYLDLAGRSPLPEEQQGHLGRTRAEVLQSLAGSLPFFQHFYEEQLFYFLLIDNFRPSTASGFVSSTKSSLRAQAYMSPQSNLAPALPRARSSTPSARPV